MVATQDAHVLASNLLSITRIAISRTTDFGINIRTNLFQISHFSLKGFHLDALISSNATTCISNLHSLSDFELSSLPFKTRNKGSARD